MNEGKFFQMDIPLSDRACDRCGARVSPSATRCPKCNHRLAALTTQTLVLVVIMGLFVVFCVVVYLGAAGGFK